MEKLDRLGWAAGLSVTSHGVRIGLRTNEPAVLERLHGALPPAWRATPSRRVDQLYSLWVGRNGRASSTRAFHLAYFGASRLVRTLDLDEACLHLQSSLHLNLAVAAPRRLFVHAGTVGWKGRAILVPGRSHSGKTSLVAALVRAGAVYYSDEYAVLDERGRVHPYAKPLSLRPPPGEHGRPHLAPVEELGGRRGTAPLPVGLVVATRYREGARWRPRRLTQGQAILELLDNTVAARVRPAYALSTLSRAVPPALVVRGARGEADATAEAILRRLEEHDDTPTTAKGAR